MVESFIIFNNRNSLDFDIVIDEEWLPSIQDAEEEIEIIKVPGRDGCLTINKGRKEPINKKVLCVLLDESRKAEVKKWLKGEGNLILSNENDVYYYSRIIKPVEFRHHWNGGWEFEVELLCQPYGYLHSGGNLITINAKNTILHNPTDEISKPLIKIYGTGTVDLILNNKIHKFNINEYVEIDSELMESYKDTSLVTFTGDFPEFAPGQNTITWNGTVTKIEVIPRWRR